MEADDTVRSALGPGQLLLGLPDSVLVSLRDRLRPFDLQSLLLTSKAARAVAQQHLVLTLHIKPRDHRQAQPIAVEQDGPQQQQQQQVQEREEAQQQPPLQDEAQYAAVVRLCVQAPTDAAAATDEAYQHALAQPWTRVKAVQVPPGAALAALVRACPALEELLVVMPPNDPFERGQARECASLGSGLQQLAPRLRSLSFVTINASPLLVQLPAAMFTCSALTELKGLLLAPSELDQLTAMTGLRMLYVGFTTSDSSAAVVDVAPLGRLTALEVLRLLHGGGKIRARVTGLAQALAPLSRVTYLHVIESEPSWADVTPCSVRRLCTGMHLRALQRLAVPSLDMSSLHVLSSGAPSLGELIVLSLDIPHNYTPTHSMRHLTCFHVWLSCELCESEDELPPGWLAHSFPSLAALYIDCMHAYFVSGLAGGLASLTSLVASSGLPSPDHAPSLRELHARVPAAEDSVLSPDPLVGVQALSNLRALTRLSLLVEVDSWRADHILVASREGDFEPLLFVVACIPSLTNLKLDWVNVSAKFRQVEVQIPGGALRALAQAPSLQVVEVPAFLIDRFPSDWLAILSAAPKLREVDTGGRIYRLR